MDRGLTKEKLLWMAGEIHLARRRIREAIFMMQNSDQTEFYRSCHRFELEAFKQYAPFYAYEDKDFLNEIVRGDHRAIRCAITFLEADPYCFRSGFIKKKLCTALKKAPLVREERALLREIVLARLLTQRPVSFADFASLGCHLYTPGFHERVRKLHVIPFKYLLNRQKRFLVLLDEEVRKRKNFKAPEKSAAEKITSSSRNTSSFWHKLFADKFLTPFKKGISELWK